MELKNIVFMKYGTHAGETASAIIQNKVDESISFGQTFWGYGGTTCHPIKQIQPFIKRNAEIGEYTYLVLSRIDSVWNRQSQRAKFFSYNNIDWQPIPEENCIKGSKYAIICSQFLLCDLEINLSLYQVPFGNAKGRLLSSYICGMNTKGCGQFIFPNEVVMDKIVKISAVGVITNAVFVR